MHHIEVSRWNKSQSVALVKVRLTHQAWDLETTMYCKASGLILSTDDYDDPYWWMILDSPTKLEGVRFLVNTYRPVIHDPDGLLPAFPPYEDARTVAVLLEERRGRLVAHVRTSNFTDVMHDAESMPSSSPANDPRGTYIVPFIPHVTEEPLRQFVTRWGADLFDLDDVLGLQKSSSTDNKGDRRSTPTPLGSPHDRTHDRPEDFVPAW